jgi:hypothetical protein
MISARDRILPPYTRRIDDWRHRIAKGAIIGSLLMLAMVMGFWLALFGTYIAQPFFGLIGLLFLVALWLADDTEPDYRRQVTSLLFLFLGLELMWPPYIAFDVPGLPWITPPRIALALLVFMGLIQLAQSARARGELIGVLSSAPAAMYAYLLFWMCAFSAALIGRTPGTSLGYTLAQLLLWNMGFLVACWVMTDARSFPRFIRLLLIGFSVIFLFTVFEYMQRKPVWLDYIPNFLKVDGAQLETIAQAKTRAGEDRYRAKGNLGIHLYFAQSFLLMVPFVVHYVFTAPRLRGRFLAVLLLLFALVTAWMTNTRTAMTGWIVLVLAMVGLYALRRFLNPTSKSDMVAPAIFMAAPAAAVAVLVAIAASPRLQTMTLGGVQHRGSSEVRDRQWSRAIEHATSNPFGYGGGNSGELAGRINNHGTWIVDSAWINFILDYGVIGAFAFLLMGSLLIYAGVRLYLRGGDESADLCGPAAVSLFGFGLTMYTISYFGNFAMMLMMVAGILATRYRLGLADAKLQPTKPPPPLPIGRRALAAG